MPDSKGIAGTVAYGSGFTVEYAPIDSSLFH